MTQHFLLNIVCQDTKKKIIQLVLALDGKAHESLYESLWQSVQSMMLYFSLDQSGGHTDNVIPRINSSY